MAVVWRGRERERKKVGMRKEELLDGG
ncbi:uncharacterized protein G2W53_025673 [Senna tora]|uniref:Uncharacterized protein n=1 Tax=Senna tora TaxID=362788 RepID=A0A834WGQ2_9FABA|nr:uncharacterized protein G2W53_025673 [Senna tora]